MSWRLFGRTLGAGDDRRASVIGVEGVRFASYTGRLMNRRAASPWTGVLLCAGLGTRLRPLTDELPKPLVPVVDTPLARFAAQQLVASGGRSLRLNAFHLAPQVTAFAQSLSHELAIEVACHVEAELLGTAGGVAELGARQGTIVVWNGDIFAPDLSLDWVSDTLEVPTLLISQTRTHLLGPNSGTIGLDSNGDVVRLRGERFGAEMACADYVGVAAFPEAFVASLPRVGCLIADGLLPWLRAGKRVRSRLFDGYWSDGGTLREYAEQNFYWLARTGRTSYVASDAACGLGVSLRDAVVGTAARVSGVGMLRRTLVMPGAVATAPLSDAIVTSSGQVIRFAEGVS